MTTLYNDNDPFVCSWLRELIADGHLPVGEVLSTPIEQLNDPRITPLTTFHAFAGIGGWPLALQLAGWPATRSVWTGSCPCQPFSVAGARKGAADKRHLWPAWFSLIRQHRPDTIFGEQVPGAIGHGWLDGVFADLEGEGYACGAVVLGAHSVGAPHIRQRLYWVAVTASGNPRQRELQRSGEHRQQPQDGGAGNGACSALGEGFDSGMALSQSQLDGSGGAREGGGTKLADGGSNDGLAHRLGPRLEGSEGQRAREEREAAQRGGGSGGVDNPPPHRRQHEPPLSRGDGAGAATPGQGEQPGAGRELGGMEQPQLHGLHPAQTRPERDGPQGSLGCRNEHREAVRAGVASLDVWCSSRWHICLDGKSRRVPLEPSLFPLAHGFQPARVGKLRGAGNAIVPQAAALFITAFLCAERELTP